MTGYKQEGKKQTVLHSQDPSIPQEKSHIWYFQQSNRIQRKQTKFSTLYIPIKNILKKKSEKFTVFNRDRKEMLISVAKEVKDFYDEENFEKLMNRL